MHRSHPLHAFESGGAPAVELSAKMQRADTKLQIHYLLHHAADLNLSWPEPAGNPERRDGLWQGTCFELFIGSLQQASYWELNVCPSGRWNWYRLQSYRAVLSPAPLPMAPLRRQSVQRSEQRISRSMELELELPEELLSGGSLQAGLSVVLRCNDGATSHWALQHGGGEADFHRRDDWILKP